MEEKKKNRKKSKVVTSVFNSSGDVRSSIFGGENQAEIIERMRTTLSEVEFAAFLETLK